MPLLRLFYCNRLAAMQNLTNQNGYQGSPRCLSEEIGGQCPIRRRHLADHTLFRNRRSSHNNQMTKSSIEKNYTTTIAVWPDGPQHRWKLVQRNFELRELRIKPTAGARTETKWQKTTEKQPLQTGLTGHSIVEKLSKLRKPTEDAKSSWWKSKLFHNGTFEYSKHPLRFSRPHILRLEHQFLRE